MNFDRSNCPYKFYARKKNRNEKKQFVVIIKILRKFKARTARSDFNTDGTY